MDIPFWSIFTLCTELLVTASVVYVIRKAYTTGIFARTLAFGVLAYEIIFNISYMVSRELGEKAEAGEHVESGAVTLLAIFHGVFSLIMFVTLLAFFIFAARAYGRGENFFQLHKCGTITFIIAWSVSILSGIMFFTMLYVV